MICRHVVAAALLLGCTALVPTAAAWADDDGTPEAWKAGYQRIASAGRGYVVWESRRPGRWRIYRIDLDGTGLRQLSPEEPGRDHFCPHISPDGRRIAYISNPEGTNTYGTLGTTDGAVAPLHIVSADGKFDRVILSDVRAYGGDRAVVWLDGHTFIYIDPRYRTCRFDIDTGQNEVLLDAPPADSLPMLLNATARYATAGRATFSPYNPTAKTVDMRPPQDGCEPFFSRDGVWGYWMGGAGGPINRFRLADAKVSPIIQKHDPRMPKGRAYLYFPMLSASGRLFAFAASPDQHDHDTSDYDVFVAPVNPATLELTSNPVRYTFDAACDRYPDVFQEEPAQMARTSGATAPSAPVRPPKPSVPPAEPAARATQAGGAWPPSRDGLVFVWENGKRPNVAGPAGGGRAYSTAGRGRARLNRAYAMAISHGAFVADGAAGALLKACKATNRLTVEATISAFGTDAKGPARIVTFSTSAQERNFTLGQEGGQLIFRLRTPATGLNGYNPEVTLCPVRAGKPVHVAVTYAPGELVAYCDGKEVLRTDKVQGDFSNWSPQHLLFGDEWNGERPWAGVLEGVALHNRALTPQEVAAHALAYRRVLEARKVAPRIHVQAVLARTSKVPSLADIRPYTSALIVDEYRVERVVAGTYKAPTIRVAHWVILNGQTTPVAEAKPGQAVELRLEPFEANPQLASQFISDTLPENWDLQPYFDIGNP